MIFHDAPIDENDIKSRMERLEDKELLDVIKNGTGYRPQAAKAAVMVAIRRELISKEEGEKLLGYTIEKIKQDEDIQAEAAETNSTKGRVEMVVGVIIFTTGLVFTIKSSHYVWIGALVVGPILFIRGLFK